MYLQPPNQSLQCTWYLVNLNSHFFRRPPKQLILIIMYSTYLHMLCDHSFYVAIVLFQSLEYSCQTVRQSRPYKPRACFLFVFHFELTPFSDGQLSKVSARPTVFKLDKYCARICTAAAFTTRRRKYWIMWTS